MNREQAINKAKVLRKGSKTAIQTAYKEVQEGQPTHFWNVVQHGSVSAAKRASRLAGIGVALKENEKLPTDSVPVK